MVVVVKVALDSRGVAERLPGRRLRFAFRSGEPRGDSIAHDRRLDIPRIDYSDRGRPSCVKAADATCRTSAGSPSGLHIRPTSGHEDGLSEPPQHTENHAP